MRRVSVRHRQPTLRDLHRTVQLTLRESAQHWHDPG